MHSENLIFHRLIPSMHCISFVGVVDDEERMEKQNLIGGRYMQIGWSQLLHHCYCLTNIVAAP